jgi:hypothetical protein
MIAFSPFLFFFSFSTIEPKLSTSCSCIHIQPIPRYFKVYGTSMEQKSSQFAVNSQFESFSALKHGCTRATLLDVYEFVPDKVSIDRYTLKCQDKEYTWYLYATAFAGIDVWRIRKSTQAYFCHNTATLMKSLFPLKSSLSSAQTQTLL